VSVSAIILAAGQGTRMKSKSPKVLHKVAGRELIRYGLEAVRGLCADKPVVVVGFGAEQVRDVVGGQAHCVLQDPQLGTGHAVQQVEKPSKARVILCWFSMRICPCCKKKLSGV